MDPLVGGPGLIFQPELGGVAPPLPETLYQAAELSP
jgi:hypothetical protein